MAENGKLQLELVDVYGKFLSEKVDVTMRHQVLSDTKKVSMSATQKFTVTNLHAAPQGLYRIEIDPPSFLPVNQFVNVAPSGVTDLRIVFPVDPKKVTSINFAKYKDLSEKFKSLLEASTKVFSFEGKMGSSLYDGLDSLRKAGLLNILAKTEATPLSNGKTILPYIQELRELRGDRFFAVVSKELREETKHSIGDGLFHTAGGSLHHLPSSFSGFKAAGSFKTGDRYGNLQLTFFMKGDECVADIDIDDASGLKHIFQVIHNALPGNSTHPYAIHNILVAYQKLDPGYTFVT